LIEFIFSLAKKYEKKKNFKMHNLCCGGGGGIGLLLLLLLLLKNI